jgi:hypothetical protein
MLVDRQAGPGHHLRHANDAIQRGADFMAHIGQKLALGAAGGLGGVARLGQGGGVVLEVRDVGADGDGAAGRGAAVGDAQPPVSGDALLERGGQRLARLHTLGDPRVLPPDGVGVEAFTQADPDDLAEGHSDLQIGRKFGIHLGVAVVPQRQPVVGVVEGHAVRHGVDGFTDLGQGAGPRPPVHPRQDSADPEDAGDHPRQHHAHDHAGNGKVAARQGRLRRDGHRAHGREMQDDD